MRALVTPGAHVVYPEPITFAPDEKEMLSGCIRRHLDGVGIRVRLDRMFDWFRSGWGRRKWLNGMGENAPTGWQGENRYNEDR